MSNDTLYSYNLSRLESGIITLGARAGVKGPVKSENFPMQMSPQDAAYLEIATIINWLRTECDVKS